MISYTWLFASKVFFYQNFLISYLLFSTEPLVPYHVAVVAVNLAGPGRKETKDFFTREGGTCMCLNCASCVYGRSPPTLLLRILCTDESHIQ